MNLKDIKQAEYIRTVRSQITAGRERQAFIVVQQAVIHYPEDPYILSYFGYLQALVDRKYRTGVENCRKALLLLEKEHLASGKIVHTLAYLNLGRAYLAAGKRKEAIDSLHNGLKHDQNNELRNEMKRIGMRRKPPVPFLSRSNPINKYLGIILYSSKRQPDLSPSR